MVRIRDYVAELVTRSAATNQSLVTRAKATISQAKYIVNDGPLGAMYMKQTPPMFSERLGGENLEEGGGGVPGAVVEAMEPSAVAPAQSDIKAQALQTFRKFKKVLEIITEIDTTAVKEHIAARALGSGAAAAATAGTHAPFSWQCLPQQLQNQGS